ncbi:hypothetical protein ABZ299_27685 [Streptomyces sp. NPDC006184]|uniref:hypothetical protein n=1 Tax=Streptomyces sp. NPDC006184 TaxID=3155455 RepID=UPI00339F1E3A
MEVVPFHPFDDGNARSALLACLYVLAREGVALDGVRLLRRVTFQADEPRDALTLAGYLDLHRRETRRRGPGLLGGLRPGPAPTGALGASCAADASGPGEPDRFPPGAVSAWTLLPRAFRTSV